MSGSLTCEGCGAEHPILDGIPRFVPLENYAGSFGFQWNTHDRTQYDGTSRRSVSETRFREETKWGAALEGEVVIEAGCGSGRFTPHALATGATVLTFDFSNAVEANFRSNSDNPNACIVQASLYEMPFRDGYADRLFCFGVLQHTPNPLESFRCLTTKVRAGGHLAADIYALRFRTLFWSKYWVRPITSRFGDDESKYRLFKRYVDLMWPLARLNMRVFPNWFGRKINWQLFVPDYSEYDLTDEQLKQWAYLDLFDMLAPAYDRPKSRRTFQKWFKHYGFRDIDVHYGYNGVEGRGIKL